MRVDNFMHCRAGVFEGIINRLNTAFFVKIISKSANIVYCFKSFKLSLPPIWQVVISRTGTCPKRITAHRRHVNSVQNRGKWWVGFKGHVFMPVIGVGHNATTAFQQHNVFMALNMWINRMRGLRIAKAFGQF